MALGFGGSTTGNASMALTALVQRLSNTRPLVEKMTERSAASQQKNIDESHSPAGDAYPPLADSTKAGRGFGHPYGDLPLKDSGDMYGSIQAHAELQSETSGWAGPDEMVAPYFAYQNQGAPRAGIPVRQFIGISADDTTGWQDDVHQFAAHAVGG